MYLLTWKLTKYEILLQTQYTLGRLFFQGTILRENKYTWYTLDHAINKNKYIFFFLLINLNFEH